MPENPLLKLKRSQIIRNKKSLSILFQSKRLHTNTILFFYAPNEVNTQVFFSVPKKKIRLAHDRIAIKRRIKEAYRLHQDKCNSPFSLGFVYKQNTMASFNEIETDIINGLTKLNG